MGCKYSGIQTSKFKVGQQCDWSDLMSNFTYLSSIYDSICSAIGHFLSLQSLKELTAVIDVLTSAISGNICDNSCRICYRIVVNRESFYDDTMI